MKVLSHLSLIFLATASVHAEALWPEFRGPTAQGHSTATGLPTEWNKSKNVIWSTESKGRAWSSPIVADGKIFLTDATEKGNKLLLHVLALDATSGKELWNTEVLEETDLAAKKMHQKNSHASPSAIWQDGRIYAHFGHHGTACVDEAGTVLWTTQENRYAPVHGTGGSPVIVDDLLIFNADAAANPSVIALDKNTGKTRWKIARSSETSRKFSFCTPLVIEVNGQKQVITPGSGVVQSLNPSDGTEIWHVSYGQGYSVVPRPIFAHGLIFLSTGYDKPVAYAIKPDGKGDVTNTHVAWTADKRIPHNPSMVVVGDEIYMLADNGLLSCRDAKTGTVHYEDRLLGPSSASLLAADGRIYAIDEQGNSAVVKPGKTLEVIAKNDLNEKTLASMAVCDSDLLIRTEKALYRIGLR